MQRTSAENSTFIRPGVSGYRDKNDQDGSIVPGTRIAAIDRNAVQEELIAPVEFAIANGLKNPDDSPFNLSTFNANDPSTYKDLLTAMLYMIGGGHAEGNDTYHLGTNVTRLPDGRLLQWGTTTSAPVEQTVNLHIAFPNTFHIVQFNRKFSAATSVGSDNGAMNYDIINLSSFKLFNGVGNTNHQLSWLAIGD